MRVLITGVSGFVGSHLVEFLLDKNCYIIGTFLNNSLPNEQIKQYKCDVRNQNDITKVIREHKPDYVYHLAGPAFVPESFGNPRETLDTLIQGTLNVLEAIREYSPLSKLLYVGSATEYGDFKEDKLPLNEKHLLQPLNPYSVGKASGSLLCYQYNKLYGIQAIRVRPFNHFGPRQSAKFVCSSFAKQIVMIENGLIPNKITVGNLNVFRDFLDVRDVVNAYWLLMEHGEYGEVYNISSGEVISIQDILDYFIQRSKCSDIKVFQDESKMRGNEAAIIYGNCKKLKQATGWKPVYNLYQTLDDTLTFWRETL